MPEKKSWRQLGSPALCDWFYALHPDAFSVKGRDSHLLSRFLKETDVLPTQVLEGMLYGYGCKAVPIFLSAAEDWLLDDRLEQEARLVEFLSGQSIYDLRVYLDLRGNAIQNYQQQRAWETAREALVLFTDEVLDAPALSPHHPRIRKALQRREERLSA